MAKRNSPRPKNAPAPKGNAHGKAGLHAVSMSKVSKSPIKPSSKYKASDFAGKDGHWVTMNGTHVFVGDK